MVKLSPDPPESSVLLSELPKDYILAPKGNVYITKNCRSKTQATDRPVFIVHNHKKQTLGIGVPESIYHEVLALSSETADARAKAVERKDSALENKTKVELMKQFPKIPQDKVPAILKHMLKKRSGRVGRTSELLLPKVVALGVRAHIRHKYTDYDKMMREGIEREEARRQIQNAMDTKVQEWGGKAWSGGVVRKPRSKKKSSVHKVSRQLTTKLVSRPKRVSKA